ncbi:MAG TPA: gliding motility-associated C-terminal domain-containing protein [Saprospiraceae bacterium]|nr:gliding motility-associated C-terminal domain-containing protein [Saprospiraceae bacterium]HMQ84178.1 gliding motility-associated C-terminal domain-containing protein [Saprospiraceae bacterium]
MRVFVLAILMLAFISLKAQIEVRVTIESGTSITTCTDIGSAPDPLWDVEIESQGWVTYPFNAPCFTSVPNDQYLATYPCPADVPAQLELCFRAFENDPLLPIGCLINRDCDETICDFFTIPAPGSSIAYTLSLPAGGASEGAVNFTITTSDLSAGNDMLCNAFDMGVLTYGDTLGNMLQGGFNNYCATNVNEPSPAASGAFTNEYGVWFQFTTGNNVGTLLAIQALSDPQVVGDSLDVQLAIYGSSNNACNGSMTLLTWANPSPSYDAFMILDCPQPNTTYYLMVDGAFSNPGSLQGEFGLQVINIGVDDAPDLVCNALSLGAVPTGGTVNSPEPLANFCATSTGDPFSPNFVVQSSVWFSFVAPPSGHVIIEAISDTTVDSIGVQMGLYRSASGVCSGFLQHIASSYTFEDLDETLQVSCLFEGQTYYILIDGDGAQNQGIFTLSVTDAGDITPVFNQALTICDGDQISVGSSTYTTSGVYADTIPLFQGCDSIVNTTLTVLAPISIQYNQTLPAVGIGTPTGVGIVGASGGAGNYTYLWCNGVTGQNNSMLVGGSECCVTVTDGMGCSGEACFTIDYVSPIETSFTASPALCFGAASGEIQFTVSEGQAPYTYVWFNGNNTINGNGVINAENETVILPDLPAGNYTIRIMDDFFMATIEVTITQPEPMDIQIEDIVNASCYSFCDGSATVGATGGTGAYSFNWSNLENGATITELCAGGYQVTATDINGCTATDVLVVGEPDEFLAEIVVLNEIDCFGGVGSLRVYFNGSAALIEWSNGENTPIVNTLPTGEYSVMVMNANGCIAFDDIVLEQPAEPLTAEIEIVSPVTCPGDQDAILMAIPDGPAEVITYKWTTGSQESSISGIGAGPHGVTVTNEKGCQFIRFITVPDPDPIEVDLKIKDPTCLPGGEWGGIIVRETYGGRPPYLYSIDQENYQDVGSFSILPPGSYYVYIMDISGCEQNVTATISEPPAVVVSLGQDTTINLGDSLTLFAQTNQSGLVFNWVSTDEKWTTDINQTTVFPLISNAYQVTALDTATNCKATDIIFISVSSTRKLYIPNAFSPNGDGRNDLFYIHSDEAVQNINSMRVFARNGALVYERLNFLPNDDSEGWDGILRGKPLDPGVFVYVIEVAFKDGATEVFSGDVVLMK